MMELFLPDNFNMITTLNQYYTLRQSTSGTSAYTIRFDKNYSTTRVINSNPAILSFLLKKAHEILENENQFTWSNKVKRLLIQDFNGQFLNIQSASDKFNISTRTLQRNLNSENTNYRALVRDVKFQLAQHYLDKGLSVKETAYNLGFKNQSNFSRAFKKWSGHPATG